VSAQGIAATSADDADVVVIGDGPAGSALALACQRIGVSVVLVGDNAPWNATYSTWSDELDAPAAEGLLCIADVTATSSDEVWAYGASAHRLRRAYVTLDNNRLRTALRDGVPHRGARVTQVVTAPSGSTARHRLELSGGRSISARVVVDATGWPALFARGGGVRHAPAWQTAIGVVLATPPAGELGRATFMDFRHVPDAAGRRSADDAGDATTFCYSLPTTDGWLVEETVLAARPAVDPISLLPRLAARLGCDAEDLLGEAIRTDLKITQSLFDSQTGSIAADKGWIKECMSVLFKSVFSYHEAAGSIISEYNADVSILKFRLTIRSIFPLGLSLRHFTSFTNWSATSSAIELWCVPK